MVNWWESPFRVFQTNIREIDAGLDVERHVAEIKKMGANTWLLNTAGIVSFYPSKLPFQHPSAWLKDRPSGDLIGDAVEAAHQQGVRVVSRIDFSKLHQDVYEEHPDWFFVAADGQNQIYNGLFSTCPSGPYYQEKSLEIIDEVMENYDNDGFFFNWFSFSERDYSRRLWGPCHCVNCQEAFRAETGMEVPSVEDWSDPAWVKHIEFKRRVLADVSGQIRDRIRQKPGVCLLLRQTSDVTMHEVNGSVDRPLPLWRYWPGENAKLDHGTDASKPVVTNVVLFLDLPYRFSAEQPGLVSIYGAQVLAHKVNPWIYVLGTLDQPDRKNFEAGSVILKFSRDHQDLYENTTACPKVVLVQSTKSMERYGLDRGEALVQNAFRGSYRVLIEHHIPFTIIEDTDLPAKQASGELSRYDCLVLPNVAAMSDEEAAALDEYVAGGGGIVMTYESGLFNADANKRNGFALQAMAGTRVEARREDMRSAYLRITSPDDLPDTELTKFIMVDGSFLYTDAGDGAESSLKLIPPSRVGPPEVTYWDYETDHPGRITRKHGAGKVIYFPWQVDALFFGLSLPEHSQLIASAVEEVSSGGRQVSGDIPPQVEVVLAEQHGGGRTLVHLINYSGHQDRSFHPAIELRDIAIKINDRQITRCTSTVTGAVLETRDDGAFVLPSLGWMDVLVCE